MALREERKWAREKKSTRREKTKTCAKSKYPLITQLCFEYLINNCTVFININRKLMTTARVINIIDL